MRIIVAIIKTFMLFAALVWMQLPASAEVRFAKEPLSIVTTAGVKHQFDVELALNDEQRELGLMKRTALGADQGMLFDFGGSRDVSMWMRNTLIPLDMLFINANGVISHIHANAKPESDDIISSNGKVAYVLELSGGEAARRGIAIGDHVLSHQIGNLK
ncbi:DUF192 domain-containing protein [Rhizobium oryzicola]|uniref:DUF192 domain-containing protein n=1 Tax=Rhizobium oryzicola TaxID=1232668 RepID=A0ABT8T0C9_9HYPH|nr:DUF192 domain-containing protein [Rhizobium oryzicola]MDO1583849.1 DUF192 domain-containing protein [Rhizobium oryzicola]